jgi:hypothetical protein
VGWLGGLLLALAAVQDGWGPRVAVTIDPRVGEGPITGRLIVAIDDGGRGGSLRERISQVVGGPRLLLARDVDGVEAGEPVLLDERADRFPPEGQAAWGPGTYRVQAVLKRHPDLNLLNAPGDLYSEVVTWRVDRADAGGVVAVRLDREEPAEVVPEDTEWVRYRKLASAKLSAFYGRPIFVRVAVAVPRGFEEEPERRYPTWVRVGGFGSRYTELGRDFGERSRFLRLWTAEDTPRFLVVHLDGAGPLGDPYQVNSANHGPFGDALIEEVLPAVEREFRGNGKRVVSGVSTGGWVSLALQVFYPDAFAGCWSAAADPVDFRRLQRVNVYDDENAYVEPDGSERPACRDPRTGRVRYTMRREVALEALMGRGGRWELSGGQWASWNATFGPRGADGWPVPLWDGRTGRMDRSVGEWWRRYDLRLFVEEHWASLGPKLRGKVHIWMGDRDDYFLDEAMRLFADVVGRLDPPADFAIRWMPGRGHVGPDLTERELLGQMAAAVGAEP